LNIHFRKSDGPVYGFFDDDGVWVGLECVCFRFEPVADIAVSSGTREGDSDVDAGDGRVSSGEDGTVVLSTGYVTGTKMKVWSAGCISYVETWWLLGMSISIR
jgi:hypothetical protein